MTTNIDSFFSEPPDSRQEARELTLEAISRFLIWTGDAPTLADRGLRTSVALYCLRPDLVEGVTLEELGLTIGCTRQAVHQLASSFRRAIGLVQ